MTPMTLFRLRTVLFIFVVAAVAVGGMLAPAPRALAQGPIADAQVVTDYLNLRATPDINAPIVQRLPYGTLLTAQGRNADGAWLYISTPAGVMGWVRTNWLALRSGLDVMSLPVTQASGTASPAPVVPAPAAAQPPAQPAEAPAPIAAGSLTVSATSRVNMRSGPGTQYGRLGVLSIGTQMTLQARDATSQWLYGSTGSMTGWVSGLYLNADPNVIGGLPVADASAPTSGGSAGAAPAPAASSAARGSFGLGGQVADFSQDGWMRSAGMSWVKRQVVYNNGANPGDQAGLIADAHNRGFRILLSVKGHPGELAADPNYLNNFAGYLGGLAAAGADAIEVWNEMNIDREWPAGRIDPGWYTQMLAAAYNAIKANNGSTIVISGAPSPTGAEGAFGLSRVWNDDRYVRGMAAAGAASYMDCVGVHYNEGIVSPSQRSGDPRDGYYTRYFWGMVDTYWNAFGGRRPLCFTEIGYLSPEGYGALPGGFAWAQNVTVAQQAQWLGEAARLARNSGKVSLFIVWNVDFTGRWGDDPMGGYAIVRPGGDCPACRALASS